MRKRYIFLLVISLLIGVLPTQAFGVTLYDKELEEVILKVKELFSISDDYDNFNSQVNTSGNNTNFYLNWTDSNNKLESISVNTDSKGNIISYNKYNPIYIQPESKLPNYSKNEALDLAMSFINKVDPKVANEIKLQDNNSTINSWDIDYNFSFTRFVNDIPYTDNNININVNKFTGEVDNYYINWERNIEFPNTKDIITLEKGQQTYKEQIGLDLMYKSSYRIFKMLDTNEETKYFLAYSTMDTSKAIDALTGEVISLGYYGPMYSNEKTMEARGSAESPTISPEERAEIDKLSGIKNIEEIEKTAREILELEDDFVLQNRNLYSSWKNPGDFQWALYFTKKLDDNRNYTTSVTLDAKTKELISFYRYNDYDSNAKATISQEEALQLAKNYINKAQSDKYDQVELVNEEWLNDGQIVYNYRFIRKINDIYVESDSISVGVDAVNNIISSYNFEWFKGDFPQVGELIGLDKAYDTLFNKIGYELKYATIYDYDKPEDENKEIRLVYSINTTKPAIIGANSGEILDSSGSPYNENKAIEYRDLDKSYAKDKIITLAEYGIGFNSDEFKPKELIKQRDFIYLLWKSMNTYRSETEVDIDKIFEELTNSRIIVDGEKNLDKIVNKEEAVKFVIRAMNYGKLAQIPNIYADLFKDSAQITPELKGHLTIAYGLKIINGDGSGMIKPKDELKREDAASIIYNYMFN